METSSLFAQVIQDHLELKQKNSGSRRAADRPLQVRGSVREPPALQDRGAGSHRGDDGRRGAGHHPERAAIAWPTDSTSRRPRRKASGASRATSTGATEVRRLALRLTDDLRCALAALAYFFDPGQRHKPAARARSSVSPGSRAGSGLGRSPTTSPWRARSSPRSSATPTSKPVSHAEARRPAR